MSNKINIEELKGEIEDGYIEDFSDLIRFIEGEAPNEILYYIDDYTIQQYAKHHYDFVDEEDVKIDILDNFSTQQIIKYLCNGSPEMAEVIEDMERVFQFNGTLTVMDKFQEFLKQF
jgi:hypothetical protein